MDQSLRISFLQVWQSVERGQWLGEEPYEMSDDFPSARLYRLERQASGLLYRPRLFSPAGSVFVSSSCTNPPAQQLERLLTLTGGKVKKGSYTYTHRISIGGGRAVRELPRFFPSPEWNFNPMTLQYLAIFLPQKISKGGPLHTHTHTYNWNECPNIVLLLSNSQMCGYHSDRNTCVAVALGGLTLTTPYPLMSPTNVCV